MGLRGPNARGLKGRSVAPPKGRGATHGRATPSWAQRGLSRAEKVIRFIQSLTITSGIKAGERFTLLPFQREIIERWYATDAAGRRIVRSGLLSLARKGGKTSLLGAIACAHLVGPEVERRGQIVAVAASREQATLLFDEIHAFLSAHPLRDRVNIQTHAKVITDLVSGTRFRALPSDAKTVYGLSPSLVILDELGVWGTGRGRQLYEAVTTAGGGRKEPLIIVISTQSADDHSVMSELVNYTKAVNDGTIADPTFAGFVYEVPDGVDPLDESVWASANPGLGVFRSVDEIRVAAAQARQMPARLASFRNLYCNQRVHAEGRWLSVDRWDAGQVDELGPLEGRVGYVGLDIAAKVDLTALSLLMPNDLGGYDIALEFFLPGDMVDALGVKARLPYRDLARAGHLTLTSGTSSTHRSSQNGCTRSAECWTSARSASTRGRRRGCSPTGSGKVSPRSRCGRASRR